MSSIEAIAALLGVINIWLIRARSVWNYLFGIAMVLLYCKIFWDAKLYSDAGLQIFFLVLNIYGWASWATDKAREGDIVVRRLSRRALSGWIAVSTISTALWGWVMHANTDASYPWWDASVAMFSVVGQILMTRRFIENWHWWIVVNCLSIPLYLVKGLNITVALYAAFLVLAVAGLLEWQRAEAKAHK